MSHPSGRTRGRAPDVDPELIRQVMSAEPRPTAAQAAATIAGMLGKPVSVSLIKSAIHRHREEWQLGTPPLARTCGPAMFYACEEALGPIRDEHKSGFHWIMLTAYERGKAGLISLGGTTAIKAQDYVAYRWRFGLVTDYALPCGFHTRAALPWELDIKSYFKIDPPEYARLEMEQALLDPGLSPDVRREWQEWLDLSRAAAGVLTPRGDG